MTTAIVAPKSWQDLTDLELHKACNDTAREMRELAPTIVADPHGFASDPIAWVLERYDFGQAEHARRGITITRQNKPDTPEIIAERERLGMQPGESLADALRRGLNNR